MVKSEKDVIEVTDEGKRPAANNRRGIVPFKATDLKFVKHLRWSFFAKIVYFHIIFTKSSILYVWPGSNYTSEIRMTIQHYVDSFQNWYASVWFVGISLRIFLAIPNDHDEKSYKKNQRRNDNTVILRQIWLVLNQPVLCCRNLGQKMDFFVSHNPFGFSILLKNFNFFPDFKYLTCFPL